MKCTFAYDGVLFYDSRGTWYGRDYSTLLKRYNTLSDDITFLMRTTFDDDASKKMSQMPERINVQEVPNILGLREYWLNRSNAEKIIEEQVSKTDFLIIRLPGMISRMALRLALKYKKPYIVEVVGCVWDSLTNHSIKGKLLAPLVEKWLSRYTDILITINREDYVRAKNSFKAGRVEYIPGVGLDTKKFSEVIVDKLAKRREIGVPEDAFVILSVGEINKNKNHETVIKAVAKLNNPNVHYIICGQGPLENYLRGIAKGLGLEKQVHLLGYRTDIAEICKASDIFAFPSKREGLGLAALEAMASGLPIVTSNVHGIVDYSINGETGYTCAPTDVDGFAKAIEILLNDEELRIIMGKHNSEVVKLFDIDKVKNKLRKIYEEEMLNV